MKKYLFILFAFLVIMPSCKYEEGPFFSIYSKAERIMGNKTFKKVLFNDEDKTSEYGKQYLEFTKSGGFVWTYYSQTGIDSSFYATWELYDDKESIKMEVFKIDTSYIYNWKIKRLTYADMHLERTDEDGNAIRWELYQAY